MRRKRLFGIFRLVFLLVFGVMAVEGHCAADAVTVALDPGHGGEENGAEYYGMKEKDLNLRLSELVKAELEEYEDIRVVVTRESDEELSLGDRARRAAGAHADILISLHFNAGIRHTNSGASVYVTTAEKYRGQMMDLADLLLGGFEALGIENAGTFARTTQVGRRRADGTFDDYYGVIRHAYNLGMPAMIVEHCHVDSPIDHEFLKREDSLSRLAEADAKAIAAFYGCKRRDGGKVTARHATRYGVTTKGLAYSCESAPNIVSIEVTDNPKTVPEIVKYRVGVVDEIGVSSIYLVYRNTETGARFTLPLIVTDAIGTGEYELSGVIPKDVALGNYSLRYIGANNLAGYDAGYNRAGSGFLGFGKCEWLNEFAYGGEADIRLDTAGEIDKADWELVLSDILKLFQERCIRNNPYWGKK